MVANVPRDIANWEVINLPTKAFLSSTPARVRVSVGVKETTNTASAENQTNNISNTPTNAPTYTPNTDTPTYSNTTTEVSCPKCGSNQIQLVRRKWSPLTGLFTNKVDRVCVNCKYKF